MSYRDEPGAIAFAEQVLELLDEGMFTATYKYAVLLALLDICLERTKDSGEPPDAVTTRQMAEQLVAMYWPHAVPFAHAGGGAVLRQSTLRQASIVTQIERFRMKHTPDPTTPRWEARNAAPAAYEQMVRAVEWTLIQMPLPRLQRMGGMERPFIYQLGWDERVSKGEVSRYQRGARSRFDNRILLLPRVGGYLLALAGVIRPLVQRRWAEMVAQVNHLQESQLEAFLFGRERASTARVRSGLWEFQERRCFYCDTRIGEPTAGEVDHFIPWARYPDDGLDNLVLADRLCNQRKGSSLPASEHLARWALRLHHGSAESRALQQLAESAPWHRPPSRSLGVARAIYLRLPSAARLWRRSREFVPPDAEVIRQALDVLAPIA